LLVPHGLAAWSCRLSATLALSRDFNVSGGALRDRGVFDRPLPVRRHFSGYARLVTRTRGGKRLQQ